MTTKYDKDWVVLEGVISRFEWAPGNENLLNKISPNIQNASVGTGIAGVALDLYGSVAISSMVATYDGEYTEHFVCMIGEHVAFGEFSGARKLQNGDHVKAIASRNDKGAYFVQAIQRPKDELIWLPPLAFSGKRAALKEDRRFTWKSSFIVSVIIILMYASLYLFDDDPQWEHVLYFSIMICVIAPVMTFLVGILPYNPMKEAGSLGSAIFKKFGFPNPDDLDMHLAGLDLQVDEEHVDSIYMYGLALKAHSRGKKIQTRFDREDDQVA